jgi:hypothetical protein
MTQCITNDDVLEQILNEAEQVNAPVLVVWLGSGTVPTNVEAVAATYPDIIFLPVYGCPDTSTLFSVQDFPTCNFICNNEMYTIVTPSVTQLAEFVRLHALKLS